MLGKWFNSLSLRSKLLLLHLLISIPIILISIFFLKESTERSYTNMHDLSVVSVNQLSDNIATQFDELYNISERLLAEGSIRKYISTNFSKSYDSYKEYIDNVKPILDVMTMVRTDIRIELYSDNPMVKFSTNTSQDLNALARREWYQQDRFTIKPTWIVENADRYGVRDNTVGFYRMISLPTTSARQKTYTMAIAVTIQEESLYSLIASRVSTGRQMYLFREDGKVVCSTDRSVVFGDLDSYGLGEYTGADMPAERNLTMNGIEYLAILKPFNVENANISDWKILYLIPVSELTQNNTAIMHLGISLCIICMAVSLFITHVVADSIVKRITKLSGTIIETWNSKFEIYAEVTGSDEIGKLETNFNAMIQKIASLIEEVFQTNLKYLNSELQHNRTLLEKRNAEISALSAQINPHYLFNTLEAIKMNLMVKHNIDETVNTLDAFASNFRFIIDTSNNIVTLKEELQFLRKYTTIQKYSFGENLKFEFSISDKLLDCTLPKLLLQPLVENALYHGIMPKEGGTITISAQPKNEEYVLICVSDDGVGIDEAQLTKIRESLVGVAPVSDEGGTHIALNNIARRLRLVYEDKAEMQIDSTVGAGTSITIRIPLKPKQ